MIKKYSAYIFSIGIMLIFLLTCITGVRVIGKSIYTFHKGSDAKSPTILLDEVFTSVEKGFNDAFFGKDLCINVYGLIQNFLNKDIVFDEEEDKSVLLGSDKKLYFKGNILGADKSDDTQMYLNAEKLNEFYKYLSKNNISFLFVMAPNKFNSEQITLPLDGVPDYNEKSEKFDSFLDKNNIPHINLKQMLNREAKCYSDGFFITDHHWNIDTAFWGFQKIADYLNNNSDFNIEKSLYDKKSYEFKTVKNVFLGSMGKRVGKYYAGTDDITVISPEYDTMFDVEYETKTLGIDVKRHGNYNEAILADEVGYNMYITSDNAQIKVDNLLNNDGHNTLFIKDSFGVPVAAWLSCISDNTWVIDLRYAQEESMVDFVKDKKIDTVIILYNVQAFESEEFFVFDEVSTGK